MANIFPKCRDQPKKKRGRPAGTAKKEAPAKKPAAAPKKPKGTAAAKKKSEASAEESGDGTAEVTDKPAEDVAAEA